MTEILWKNYNNDPLKMPDDWHKMYIITEGFGAPKGVHKVIKGRSLYRLVQLNVMPANTKYIPYSKEIFDELNKNIS